jgi:hypothetical protein
MRCTAVSTPLRANDRWTWALELCKDRTASCLQLEEQLKPVSHRNLGEQNADPCSKSDPTFKEGCGGELRSLPWLVHCDA